MAISLKGALCGLAFVTFAGCLTPTEKKAMKDDIYNTQTRLLNLEQALTNVNTEAKNTGDSASKRIASTSAQLEKIQRDLAQLRGDLDAIKQGVQTGAMPGSDPADESTVAGRLGALTTRLEAVETAQAELLDTINKVGAAKKGTAAKDKKGSHDGASTGGGKFKDVAALQKAFDAKQYKAVAEEAPKLAQKGAAKDKEQARFLAAESLFKLGKLQDAALKYNDFIEGKPSKKYLPTAKMRIGDCFRHLGDASTAQVYYEELIKEFPNSDEATKAKERLGELGKGNVAEKG